MRRAEPRGTLRTLAEALYAGRTSSVDLVERALAAIDAPQGEGERAFLLVDRAGAVAAAEDADRRRAAGVEPSPFCGLPISVKDLFDVRGQVTRAGSRLLERHAPAAADAVVVERLRNAGFVLIGRTNMTEFAYSGLGLNPHYGTPLNPWQRDTGRIPGGSSSGAAVSVADGMAAAAIGTDTGGSCRIPAAMCGIVGFKPTASRIPRQGVLPLSDTLDSVGPLARTVDCCAILDGIMSGVDGFAVASRTKSALAPELGRATLGVLRRYATNDVEAPVAAAFERAIRRLEKRGVKLVDVADVSFPQLDRLPEINAKGGFAAAESYAWHRRDLAKHAALYDPRVRARMLQGAEQSAADYIDLGCERQDFIAAATAAMRGIDALIYPTVPMLPPRLADCEDDDEYGRLNRLALRNPSLANFLDACAISLPVHDPGEAPVGVNLLARRNDDEALLALAAGAEAALRSFY